MRGAGVRAGAVTRRAAAPLAQRQPAGGRRVHAGATRETPGRNAGARSPQCRAGRRRHEPTRFPFTVRPSHVLQPPIECGLPLSRCDLSAATFWLRGSHPAEAAALARALPPGSSLALLDLSDNSLTLQEGCVAGPSAPGRLDCVHRPSSLVCMLRALPSLSPFNQCLVGQACSGRCDSPTPFFSALPTALSRTGQEDWANA